MSGISQFWNTATNKPVDVSSGDPMPVVPSGALPAGDNNIGNVDIVSLPALPAGDNNIGNVDIVSLPALPAGTNNIGDVDVLTVPYKKTVPGAAANVHAPAANTAAVLTFAADADEKHVIDGVAWSYSAAPTGGSIKIEDVAATVVFQVDITAAGPGFFIFPQPLRGAAINTAMIITLAAGGAGVTGKVNALGKRLEV